MEPEHENISISRQCELLSLPRSSYYYTPCGESPENLLYMRMLDECYTKYPFYGVERMTMWMRGQGAHVNPKRVRRLLRSMGLMAIYPKRRISIADQQATVYPYLLRGLEIAYPNQVWATDITYIRLQKGFAYLVAVLDWHSRYVLSWELSATLETDFCVIALERALEAGTPEIFNTDQGCQFTSNAFTQVLKDAGIQISMDGKGRAFDNIMVERLWRSVKYEEVYLRDYVDMDEARANLSKYFRFYNEERRHQSLAYQSPAMVWRSVA